MKQLIEEFYANQRSGDSIALATVITRNGSAPRSAGAKMLVRADGGICGTVGGGILEARVQELAAEMIAEKRAVIQKFEFSGKDAATMDAICGGTVEVLVEWVDPADPQTAAVFGALRAALTSRRKAWLVTSLDDGAARTRHALVEAGGTITGQAPGGLDVTGVIEQRLPGLVELPGSRVMLEPLQIDGTAIIFGAGHVSRSLAEFTHAVGFWTVVADDRADFANRERFPLGDEILVLDSFENLAGQIAIEPDSYVVIVTRGHLNDRAVLAQVLQTGAAYIGMIGSRRKCALVFDELRKAGFGESDLSRVHAPIGLPIRAETPEEIGVSITAEMIRVRAETREKNP